MTGSTLFDAPSLLAENDEIMMFLPTITFAYLFMIENEPLYLAASAFVMFPTVFSYYEYSEDKDIDTDKLLSNVNNYIGTGIMLILLLTYTISPFVGVRLLYSTIEIVPGQLRTIEIVSTGLLLANVTFIFAMVWSVVEATLIKYS